MVNPDELAAQPSNKITPDSIPGYNIYVPKQIEKSLVITSFFDIFKVLNRI